MFTDSIPSRVLDWTGRAVCGLILLFLVLPIILVIPISFSAAPDLRFPPQGFSLRWYVQYFSDPDWIGATLFSLKVASLTMVASVAIGSAASIALVRGRVPGQELVSALVLAPLIVPHIVVAIAVYVQFAPLHLTGTTLGFVLVHTTLAVPYVILIMSAALSRLDVSLEMAALTLGASRLRTFFEVTAPLVMPAIAAGAVFAFLSSFDETVVSLFISGVENKTITRKFFEDLDFNLSPVIAAASTVIVVVTVGLMAVGQAAKALSVKRNVSVGDT
ncbi:MAG: ABC transporter permease [Rhizobiales bacterium]|nr:ABC transporter permease [Hyphomicrobiales bacterium]